MPKFRQPYTGAVNKDFNIKLQQNINVLDFGADPTGNADSTTAIQNAINAAGNNGVINFPAGTFLVSATLNGLPSQQFIGAGVNSTIIRRFTTYGDTLYFANAGAAQIRGIWFWHGIVPAAGATTLPDKDTAAHVHCGNGQQVLIENCWFWRMGWSVLIDQGSLYKISKCNLQGVWNRLQAGVQEGTASIGTGITAYAQLIEITNCYFGGYDGGAADVTITTSDNGPQVVHFGNTNAGSKYGVLAYSSEGLLIDGCYFGGNSYSNILLSPNNTLSQVRITNNFFDSASYDSPMINIEPQINGYYPTMVNIDNNCFNGELYGYQAIGSFNPLGTEPTITDFQITGNTIGNTLGSGIFLRHTQGGVISNNTVTAYNSRNLTAGGDVNYCVGIYVDNSAGTYIANNLLGGGINSSSPSSGYCYQGVVIAGTNIETDAKNNYFNGVGISGLKVGRVDKATVVTSPATTYTMTGAEDLVVINNTGTSSIQVFPPTNIPPGYTFVLKDGSGTAATHNIQLAGTVDGTLNPVYSTNYFSKTFTWNGTQWNVTGN